MDSKEDEHIEMGLPADERRSNLLDEKKASTTPSPTARYMKVPSPNAEKTQLCESRQDLSKGLGLLPYIAMVCLTLQNAAAVLIMRYCRSIPSENMFNTQTAVIMGEVLKGVLSLFLVLRTHGTLSGVWVDTREALKSGVPAMLYLLQNNLQYVAVSNLEANTYQVTYQLKILSTALLSLLFLGKSLTKRKWLALVMLTIGVALVQVSQLQPREKEPKNVNLVIGLTCTLLSTLSSGMASVYFEKMLKDGSPMDVWQRNLQLSIYSVIIGICALPTTEQGSQVIANGFFHGYTPVTWVNIAIQGGGGLLIAMVIKHADSIMKNIATSMSTVVCAVMSLIIFDTPLNAYFIAGAYMVNHATISYCSPDSTPAQSKDTSSKHLV